MLGSGAEPLTTVLYTLSVNVRKPDVKYASTISELTSILNMQCGGTLAWVRGSLIVGTRTRYSSQLLISLHAQMYLRWTG